MNGGRVGSFEFGFLGCESGGSLWIMGFLNVNWEAFGCEWVRVGLCEWGAIGCEWGKVWYFVLHFPMELVTGLPVANQS